jgi:hypothetical protein
MAEATLSAGRRSRARVAGKVFERVTGLGEDEELAAFAGRLI